jgi:L-amino acid ligase C-terminal domain 2
MPSQITVSSHMTGWVMIYAGPGVLRAPVPVPAEPWVIEARVLARPGDRLRTPRSCGDGVALVSVRGDTEVEVADRLAAVAAACTPDVRPDV